jgi:hypothetical protein
MSYGHWNIRCPCDPSRGPIETDRAPIAHQAEGDRRDRGETESEQLDRNLAALVQELRVVETGVQLLTGFLLTLPFQARFTILPPPMRWLYLAIVAASIAATVFLVGPVAAHRLLFRRHKLAAVVHAAHNCAITGLLLLGVALTGVAILIFGTVAGGLAGALAGTACAIQFLLVWLVYPWRQRLRVQ